MVALGTPFQVLTYSLLFLPALLLTTYFLSAFPNTPEPIPILPGLGSLSPSSSVRTLYPEDFFKGGNYFSAPHGKTRYFLLGPETGKKIVFINGLSIPSIIWQNVSTSLVTRGYRVLLYDLYGRGYSDIPQTKYDRNLYVTQLALLMQHVKWDRAILAGVSMGGSIASAFAASFPDLVEDRVIIIASTGLILTSDLSRTTKIMSLPLVQVLTSSFIARKFWQHLTDSSNQTALVDSMQEIVRLQSAHLPGFNAAISSSLRAGPIRGEFSSFSSDVWNGRKLLIIHGTNDHTVPYKYAAMIQNALPKGCRSEIVTIEGGPHDLTISHPDTIVNQIDRWVKSP